MKPILTAVLCTTIFFSCDILPSDMPYSSEKELKENYHKNYKNISKLKRYFNLITPNNLEVRIEFESEKSVDFTIAYITNPYFPRKTLFDQNGINPYNYEPSFSTDDNTEFAAETNSLVAVKNKLGWTEETFKRIKQLLDSANCISITNGNPTKIGFRRSGLGMYFYNLFDKPLNNSIKKTYNDSCTYRLYNDTLALEYGGGAIGPQCFPD